MKQLLHDANKSLDLLGLFFAKREKTALSGSVIRNYLVDSVEV